MIYYDLISKFLNPEEIARLSCTNKQIYNHLKQKKSLKKSIWRGSMKSSSRPNFWYHQSQIQKEFLTRTKEDLQKLLQIQDFSLSSYDLIHTRIFENKGLDFETINMERIQDDISKDIPRTYLVQNCAESQIQLYRILLATAYIHPAIGYCQGMNFVAGVLLKVMKDEETTFYTFLSMLRQFELETMFTPGVPDLALREYQLNYFINFSMPDLLRHFRQVGVTNAFFVSRWCMTLFAAYLPWEDLLEVWDCFFLEGWKVVIKVGISLLLEFKEELLELDLEEISRFIEMEMKERRTDFKDVMRTARSVRVRKRVLKRIEEDFFLSEAKIKEEAVEHTHSYSEQEIKAIRWAKEEVESLDPDTQTDIKEFQRKIEKIDEEIECFYKHFLSVGLELLQVENEIEELSDKKQILSESLKAMEKKRRKHKRKRIFRKLLHRKVDGNGSINIDENDISLLKSKIEGLEYDLSILLQERADKLAMHGDAKIRVDEFKEKKKSYSEQLCGFLNYLKLNPELFRYGEEVLGLIIGLVFTFLGILIIKMIFCKKCELLVFTQYLQRIFIFLLIKN